MDFSLDELPRSVGSKKTNPLHRNAVPATINENPKVSIVKAPKGANFSLVTRRFKSGSHYQNAILLF
jgi:hypothetical protein